MEWVFSLWVPIVLHRSTIDILVSSVLAPHFESNFEYPIDTLVLPKLSQYVPRFKEGSGNRPHLAGLRLADPDIGDTSMNSRSDSATGCRHAHLGDKKCDLRS